MNKITTFHFTGMNVLRFIAAFAIMIYHSTLSYQDSMPLWLSRGFHNLPIGVDLFFLISGFLITYLLIEEKKERKKERKKDGWLHCFLYVIFMHDEHSEFSLSIF
jgi:peptidoglycan/LPS O-acetylase OafA/YrhL